MISKVISYISDIVQTLVNLQQSYRLAPVTCAENFYYCIESVCSVLLWLYCVIRNDSDDCWYLQPVWHVPGGLLCKSDMCLSVTTSCTVCVTASELWLVCVLHKKTNNSRAAKLWRVLLTGLMKSFFAQSSKMGTVTKAFDARLANRSFVVFDFRALGRSTLSARVPESKLQISLVRDWRLTVYNWRFCQVQSHVAQKLGQIGIKNPARSNLDMVP